MVVPMGERCRSPHPRPPGGWGPGPVRRRPGRPLPVLPLPRRRGTGKSVRGWPVPEPPVPAWREKPPLRRRAGRKGPPAGPPSDGLPWDGKNGSVAFGFLLAGVAVCGHAAIFLLYKEDSGEIQRILSPGWKKVFPKRGRMPGSVLLPLYHGQSVVQKTKNLLDK